MSAFSQPLKPAYYTDVEKQLRRIFYAILYAPLLAIIQDATTQPTEIHNAREVDLTEALRSGRLQYSNGIFSGEFNAAISKALRRLGASFDSRMRVYRLDPSRVPAWIVAEATSYQMKAKGTHDQLLRVLDETVEHLQSLVETYPVNPDKSIDEIARGFKHAAQEMIVSPKLSDESKAVLVKEYSTNMKMWIQKFSSEEIVALRTRVEANALQGYRFDRLIASIKNRYSVSENKATFLARQETSLFLAKFRERRFKDAGINRYRWSTAMDGRVRHDHKHLHGQVFDYDQPPIVDQSTGRRGNPGQDYNCRCVDIPVLVGLDR